MVPADLNGLLYMLCCTIARLAGQLGQAQLQQQYERLASEQLATLHALMWDPSRGCWRDLLLPEGAGGEVAGGALLRCVRSHADKCMAVSFCWPSVLAASAAGVCPSC